MKRVLFLSMIVALLTASCGQNPAQQTETAPSFESYAISELVSNPTEYGDKLVMIEGVINHMCRHSGDKMMVKENESDLSIQVMLGELASEFSVDSEGKSVVVEGVLKYSVDNKDELGEDLPQHEGEEDHDCDSEKAAAEALKARGIDPSIRTFIEIVKYELK
ncbi:MAG: hypothetical protein R6W67_11430 [Bacteroidales bacterium]